MTACAVLDERTSVSRFSTATGADEYFIVTGCRSEGSFSDAVSDLHHSYIEALRQLGLSSATQIFCRFYVSDIANQKDGLLASAIWEMATSGAYSVVQQCPLNGGHVQLLAYHVKGDSPLCKTRISFGDDGWQNGVRLRGAHYELVMTANFSGSGALDSSEQMSGVLDDYTEFLNREGMSLVGNALRNWIYVRDIDNHYWGMVEARKARFFQHGLNTATRYLASTGIEAKLKEVGCLVSMDALSMKNLAPDQISKMIALDHMSPTSDYGVTFERGLKVSFGDRAHLHVSGTASIDKDGKIVHPEDVTLQTERAIQNVRALLQPHGAGLSDLVYAIVYVRNIKQQDAVLRVLKAELPEEVPLLVVEGSVCRPKWLVEIEGLAITPSAGPWPAFC